MKIAFTKLVVLVIFTVFFANAYGSNNQELDA